MKRVISCLSVLALAAVVCVSAVAQDDAPAKKKKGKGGGGNSIVAQIMKSLEAAKLTDDQEAKIKELGAAVQEQIKALSTEGLTPELTKKRAEALKAAREAGKKGKDLAAAANEGFSEAEKTVLTKSNEITTKFRKQVLALLTDEQKQALPEAVVRTLAGPEQGKGKGKKKAE